MKKVLYFTWIITLAALPACQRVVEDIPEPTQEQVTTTVYTLTINASKTSVTKGLDPSATGLDATWKDGDKVAVYAAGTRIGTLTPVTIGTADTQLQGTITETLSQGAQLDLLFVGQDTDNNRTWTYTGQKGTLSDIAANYDFAKAQVTVTSVSGDNLTATDANFENQQAIVKFTLKSGDSPLPVHSLRISTNSGKLVTGYNVVSGAFSPIYGDLEVTLDEDPGNEFYVALHNASGANDVYSLTTSSGSTYYYYAKDGILFADGTYRAISVKMKTETDMYTVVGSETVFGGERMILQANGTYLRTYAVNGTEGTVQFRIVKNQGATSTDSQSFTVQDPGTLSIAYVPVDELIDAWMGDPRYSFVSSINGWSLYDHMTKQTDGTFTYTANNVSSEVLFRVVRNADYLTSATWNWGKNGVFQGDFASHPVTTPCTLLFTFHPFTGVTTVEEMQ